MEFRAQLPAGGQGLWPALWLYPPNQWPPEIDVLEAVNDMSQIYMTYHWGAKADPQQDYSMALIANPSAWHVYAMEWQSGVVRWYIDGVLVKTYSGSTVTTIPMQLYLNVALGGDWPGGVADSTPLPQTMNVDYVRVYAANGTAPPLDLTAPSVSVSGPAGGSTVSGTVTVSANASDNVGVASVQFFLDGSALGAADTSAPYGVSWNTAGAPNGLHLLTALARDAAGNATTSSALTVTVNNAVLDTTAPSVSLSNPAGGSTVSGTVTVSASASDGVGVANVQFLLDGAAIGSPDTSAPYSTTWNTTAVANGSHTLRAVAVDAAGNSATSTGVTVTVNNTSPDTTAPSVSISSPGGGSAVSGSVTVSATASDNVGVTSVQFLLDGAALGAPDTTSPFSVSWTTSSVANGVHALTAVARDAAGNSKTSAAISVTVNNGSSDTTPPAVTVTAPTGGATVTGTITVAATATDNVGVVGVQFAVDGVPMGSEDTSAPYRISWITDGLPPGDHLVTATARDAAGNRQTSAGVTVSVPGARAASVDGDLNGDAVPDLIFEHASGQLYTWFMRDAAMVGGGPLTPAATNPIWQIVGLGDFDGDGKSDLVFQNSSNGQVYVWLMNNSVFVSAIAMSGDTSWRVATTGDFNGDGKPDLLWQDPATGSLSVWFMDGQSMTSSTTVAAQVDPSWRVAGSADLNNDGKTDLIWQNRNTGELVYSLMNGITATTIAHFTPAATNVLWEVRAVGDFDGDGMVDLVFQHATTGQLYIWHLSGTTMVSGSFLTPGQVDPAWRVMGGR